jgi:hypothetical protein
MFAYGTRLWMCKPHVNRGSEHATTATSYQIFDASGTAHQVAELPWFCFLPVIIDEAYMGGQRHTDGARYYRLRRDQERKPPYFPDIDPQNLMATCRLVDGRYYAGFWLQPDEAVADFLSTGLV